LRVIQVRAEANTGACINISASFFSLDGNYTKGH